MDTVQRIFDIMEDRGLTVYRVAKDTGISVGNMYNWRSGRSNPGARALEKLSVYFNVSVDYLLGKTDNPAEENGYEVISAVDENGDLMKNISPDEMAAIRAFLRAYREEKER